MRNKYFILVLTFLSLLIGQSSYAQDWQDMWDATEDDTNSHWESNDDGGFTETDFDYGNLEHYETVMNDDQYNDWLDSGGWEDKQHHSQDDMKDTHNQTDDHHVDNIRYNDGNDGDDSNDSNDNDTDIYDGLLDPYNYGNDDDPYYPYDDDQYPPGDTPNNDNNGTPQEPTTPDPSTCKCAPEKTWFFDNDRDGYHGDVQDATSSPGVNWSLVTKGEDCDDDESAKTTDCITPVWFLDNDQDGYDAGKKQVTESPGDGWIKGTSKGTDCDDTVYNKDNACYVPLKDPCLKKNLDAFLNADSSTNVFTKLFKDNFGTDLGCVIHFIEYSNTNETNVDGKAHKIDDDNFEIRLNLAALNYASDEYVTATIYHELIHNFLTMLYPDSGEDEQHEEIERDWREVIANQLKLDFPNLSNANANALAWGGLGDTPAYKKLLEDDKKNNTGVTGAIAQSNKNFKNLNNTNTTTYGTVCK